ncbi:MAG: hypothetical protein WCP85_16290 [Mariniphaga sp.]
MENIKVNRLNILKKINIENDHRFGGYFYLIRDKTDSLINSIDIVYEKKSIEISETNILYLSKIIEFCKSNNVQVYLIRSPLHKKFPGRWNEQEFIQILNSKFSKIEFLDFKDFPLQNHEFGDLGHLNYRGAKVFSVFFNGLLNSGILNRKNKLEYINDEIIKFQISRLKP